MPVQLETKQSCSQSMLWKLQRQYYAETGFEAWTSGEVPHYITSNQHIANSYANLILALLKDLRRIHKDDFGTNVKLHIIEAGAGSGRLAYGICNILSGLCEQEEIPFNSFQYILTDFTEQNLEFWKIHPCFQEYFRTGLMDIALFDMNNPAQFNLQVSGKKITSDQLTYPIVFIANYVFDTIPQELFYFSNNNAKACLVTLSTEEEVGSLPASEILGKVSIQYEVGETAKNKTFEEPYLEKILEGYKGELENEYVFLPATAIRCLDYLRQLSRQGLMLLTADKGSHILGSVRYPVPPDIVRHGSFSLNVNYHGIKNYCEDSGGTALFPENTYAGINTGCLLFMKHADQYKRVHQAFQQYINDAGPDDYFSIYKYFLKNLDTLDLRSLFAVLRYSFYDSHMLEICLHKLVQFAAVYNFEEKKELVVIIKKCWENYFPIGEKTDLASLIGLLLYEIGIYKLAIFYFRLSTGIYGNDSGTFFNMAACYERMGETDPAIKLLEQVLTATPENKDAIDLLATCKMQSTKY